MARARATLAAALTLIVCGAAPTLMTPPSAAASSAACPDANLIPHAGNLDRIRAATVCLVNEVRDRHGEAPLRENVRLEAAAQRHTEDMAFGDYFDHVGPRGDTPLQRMRAAGYIYSRRIGYEVGENIAWGTLTLGTPAAIVNAWVHSPEHLANILNARYRDTAIGVSPHPPASLAHGQSGGIYTQDFGVIVTGHASRSAAARSRRAPGRLRPLHPRGWRGRPRAGGPGPSTHHVKRRHRGYGSTRRQVRHRHRLGKRHRARHGRTAGRAGRKRAHQRPRRRHR